MEKDLVVIERKQVFTDSLRVAEKFKKQHKDVLKKIKNLMKDDEKGRLNFAPSSYINSQGKSQKKYNMDRKSFSILCMGFTGKKALKWKLKFLDAFEAMEKVLLQQTIQQQSAAWVTQRKAGKITRREETDSIKEFVDYAISQGSKNYKRYYTIFTKMQNNHLFILEQKVKNLRDVLDINQLAIVSCADAIVAKTIKEGISSHLHYKKIYELAKERVESFAKLRGKTFIPATQQIESRSSNV